MSADSDRSVRPAPEKDYSKLPPSVSLDDIVTSVDAAPVPEPEAGRNIEQHRALNDD